MDGSGRGASARGLPRTEGHRVGEANMLDVAAGAIEIGVKELSVYAFSTENWRRSPGEVRFIMGFARKVLRVQRDVLNSWNVRLRWIGRTPRLWKSVLHELREAERVTAHNTGLVLNLCINYGGRAEIADATRAIAEDVAAGRLKASSINEKTIQRYLYSPTMRDVDLFIRTGDEQRTSNFLMWSSSYAELYFSPLAWPDFNRTELWKACEAYAGRERRYGGAAGKGGHAGAPRGARRPEPASSPNPRRQTSSSFRWGMTDSNSPLAKISSYDHSPLSHHALRCYISSRCCRPRVLRRPGAARGCASPPAWGPAARRWWWQWPWDGARSRR